MTSGRFQNFLVVVVLLLCFGGTFYVYYKPTVSWFSCPYVAVPQHYGCTDMCLNVLKTDNFTQCLNNTCTINYTSVKHHLTTKQAPLPQAKDRNIQKSKTILLIWTWPFGYKFDVESCGSMYGITGCYFTDDRSLYDEADGVMLHLRDIHSDLQSLLKMPRPPLQKWVWMNMESPDNSVRVTDLDNLFNLTATYRRDSDVWVPYGRIVEASVEEKAFQIPTKDKLVCWIVSNWNDNFKRVKYFNELSRHINIEAYGHHFGKYVSDQAYPGIVSGCKFYLSFENSVYKDYITEKLFNPMKFGTVPVVLGPTRENYEEFIPGDSFIHVDDFKSPKELAEHLKFLDQNQELYERYFTWRKYFVVKGVYFGLEHACRICDHIKRDKGYRVSTNLNKWFWN